MTLLATFKHISSKNADYGAAEQYLTFEHDEFTMKPTLDEAGRLIPGGLPNSHAELRRGRFLPLPVCGQISDTARTKNGKMRKATTISFPLTHGTQRTTVDRRPGASIGRGILCRAFPKDTKPLSAPTRTDTTTAAISMFTSLSILCVSRKYPFALHGQTGRYPCRVQTPLYGRCYGILQSRGHGDVPPGKSLSN